MAVERGESAVLLGGGGSGLAGRAACLSGKGLHCLTQRAGHQAMLPRTCCPRHCLLHAHAPSLQLCDTGLLHADPHPGNLLRTTDGRIAIVSWVWHGRHRFGVLCWAGWHVPTLSCGAGSRLLGT